MGPGTLEAGNHARGLPTRFRRIWLWLSFLLRPSSHSGAAPHGRVGPTQMLSVLPARSLFRISKSSRWGLGVFLACWNLARPGGGGGNCRRMARAHAIAMATVWSFSWWLSGLQCARWRSGQVDDRGKVNRIGSLSLAPSLSRPSADPESGFDWISRELMRQAWRKASVVEISYHILICSLCERCVRPCDPMLFVCMFFKSN